MRCLFFRFLIFLLDKELEFIRWALLKKYASGKQTLPTILKIRQIRERLI